MVKRYIIITAIILINSLNIYSQDTINFKLYDSLKTKTEDRHEVVAKRKQLDSNSRKLIDTLLSRNLIIADDRAIKSDQIKTEKSVDKAHAFFIQNDPDNFDVRLFRKINNSHTPLKTKILYTTDNTALPVAMLTGASLFAYSRIKRKTYDENTAYLSAVSELTSLSLVFGIKYIVKRKRPIDVLKNVNTKDSPFLDKYSFPSGHTALTFSLATTFALRYPQYPQVYTPIYLWALVVAYGRPYFGVHYPTDLLGGAAIGIGSSALIFSLRKELFNFKNQVLGEDKNDDGSINAGVLTFFAGSFALSALFDNFIFRESQNKRFFISPWMDGKRSGMNVKWKL
jgi:undecaprenyl-diphosphatase